MPRPTVAPKASRIEERAVATSAPRIAGVQFKYLNGTPAGPVLGSICTAILPEPKEGQHGQYDDD